MNVTQLRRRGDVPLQDIVAGEVRAYLARRRVSARQAAAALGWSQPYLSRRLNSATPFDVADLEALGILLDVPVIAFFGAPDSFGQVSAGFRTAPIREAA